MVATQYVRKDSSVTVEKSSCEVKEVYKDIYHDFNSLCLCLSQNFLKQIQLTLEQLRD